MVIDDGGWLWLGELVGGDGWMVDDDGLSLVEVVVVCCGDWLLMVIHSGGW